MTYNINVISRVVELNLCSGCGLCVSVCPKKNIKMDFNIHGEYVPFVVGDLCSDKCAICLDVCPFYDNGENEDTLGKRLFSDIPSIKHSPKTGYYLDSFVGYSNQNSHRENGASGGLATWTLEKLFIDNLVDQVVCVSPNDDPEKLFKFKICNTSEEVRDCSRSCYYPVETSEVIKHILSHDGRYAIIGLPCICKAIRLAIQVSPKLKRRIKFVLGLVCGQTKSKFFAEYICSLGGGDPHNLQKVTFRIKDTNRPASDFGLKFISDNEQGSRQEGVVYRTDGMDKIWCNRYFTPNACNFCDDVFAECADAAFMDAWLPKYFLDYRGHTIALVRDSQILNLFTNAEKKEEMFLDRLDISDVIASQRDVLISKRVDIGERLRLLQLKEGQITSKRVTQFTTQIPFVRRQWIRATLLISMASSRKWVEYDKDLPKFDKAMRYLRRYATTAYCLAKLTGKIHKVFGCFLRALQLKWRMK